jgi:hypothetical protein
MENTISIELKIVITCLTSYFLMWLASYPTTFFSEWGAKKFGGYVNFLFAQAIFNALPIVIAFIHWIWTL